MFTVRPRQSLYEGNPQDEVFAALGATACEAGKVIASL